jgi:putative membrane protein
MERPKDLSITPRTAIIIIILFHAVGLVGTSLAISRPLFLQLVPWHLLLMLLVIVLAHKNFNKPFVTFLAIVFVSGIAVEWIGVHTGWLFGNYAYGATLSTKIFDIPLTIGVNWFLLVYATGVIMQRSRLKSIFPRIIAGALILVILDVLIEPVAIRFDYWHWVGGVIPIKNYICWFLVSAVLLFVFEKFNFKKQSIAATVLLITEFVFFGMLLVMDVIASN